MSILTPENYKHTHELLIGGILLSMVGGFLEANTFILRGGVFCNAQTGNITMMIVNFVQGNYHKAFFYPIPILAFVVAIFLTKYINLKAKSYNYYRWENIFLVSEIIILLLIMFIPLGKGDMIATPIISFIAAIQYNTFPKTKNIAYSSVFCTNNLRQATLHFFDYVTTKDVAAGRNSAKYLIVIISFCFGIALQALVAPYLKQYSLAIVSGILLCLLIIDLVRNRMYKRECELLIEQ